MAVRHFSLPGPRRLRLLGVAGAGLALTAAALWIRFSWAPEYVGSPAEIAASYTRLGSQAALGGQFTQAIGFYRRAVALDPHSVDTWVCLGSACADADDRAGALAALGEAKRLAPSLPDVDRALARVHLRFGQFDDARRAAERALQHAPDDAHSLVLAGLARAETLAAASDEAAVEAMMKRALDLGYGGPEPYYGLGLVELHRRRPELAIAAFRAAVQRDPRSGTMHYRLATAYRLAGRRREAERELEAFHRLTREARRDAGSLPPTPTAP